MKLIRCECGFVARGESDDHVLAIIHENVAADHPALLQTVSRQDFLSWIQQESPTRFVWNGCARLSFGGHHGRCGRTLRRCLGACRQAPRGHQRGALRGEHEAGKR